MSPAAKKSPAPKATKPAASKVPANSVRGKNASTAAKKANASPKPPGVARGSRSKQDTVTKMAPPAKRTADAKFRVTRKIARGFKDPGDLVLGIDIGGTKIAVGLVSPTGDVLCLGRIPTPAKESESDMWLAISDAATAILKHAHNPAIVGVGVGCAGPMAWPEGAVSPLNIPGWRAFPLRQHVRELFPGIPVRVHNDAIAMAAAEHWIGAGRGAGNIMGMVISTGVGGGFVLNNRLVDGGLGNAGHVGHLVVDPNGPPCKCGGRGCLEAIARGPALAGWAVENGWSPGKRQSADAKWLADDARAGNEVAIAAFERCGEAVGIAIASATAMLDLDVVVIGGGVIQAGPLVTAPISRAFDRHAGMAFTKRLRIVTAELGQEAGVVGAAALVLQGERYWNPADD